MCASSLQEDSFHLVDNKPAQRKQGMRRFQPNRCAMAALAHTHTCTCPARTEPPVQDCCTSAVPLWSLSFGTPKLEEALPYSGSTSSDGTSSSGKR